MAFEKDLVLNYNQRSLAFAFSTLHITCKLHQQDVEFIKGAVEVRISDTGVGIDKEDLPKIFNRFYQAEQAQNGEAGSGIGSLLKALLHKK